MEKFKHTPGPWEVGKSGYEVKFIYCDDPLGSAVCQYDLDYSFLEKEQRIANANLIAAAPELLEALEELQTLAVLHIGGHHNNPIWVKVANAITKATGEIEL